MGRWLPSVIFLIIGLTYILNNYGGIRSPDCEVVFRVGESLADRLSFSVSRPLSWNGFGFSFGRDGRLYAIFGPLESIVLSPLVKFSRIFVNDRWTSVPPSHYYEDGLKRFLADLSLKEPRPHTLRFIVSYLYLIFSILGTVVFYKIMLKFVSRTSALTTTLLYGLGTIAWAYAGTLFSEPLAILFILLSFRSLLDGEGVKSGLALGLASLTHLTAVLFAPFFFYYHYCKGKGVKNYVIGIVVPLIFYGLYNLIRFGSPIETGRGVSEYIYSYAVPPFSGIYGLLLSSGKGLFFYAPAVILGIISWRYLHKK
ncbi:MAG TPA: hypothetical protein EYP24_02440, partial [bacterium (Candidatus Stahlbacteria)]|nr:hypothetical protein [Candidatus Stahlbacteria bacterium]